MGISSKARPGIITASLDCVVLPLRMSAVMDKAMTPTVDDVRPPTIAYANPGPTSALLPRRFHAHRPEPCRESSLRASNTAGNVGKRSPLREADSTRPCRRSPSYVRHPNRILDS